MAQNVFGFGVEPHGFATDSLLERVPNQRLVLVVLDAHGMRPLLAAVVRPGQQASHHVLGALQPLETNHRHRCWLRPALRNAAPREFVDLVACRRVLLALGAALEREIIPRVWMLLVEQLWVQPAHDAPDFAAEPDHLLALPQPEPVRAVDDLLVDLVSGSWRGLPDLPLADAPPALADGITDHLHDPLVVRAWARRDLLRGGLRRF